MQAGDHIEASEAAQEGAPSTSYSSTASGSTTRWDAKKKAVKVLVAPSAQFHLAGSRCRSLQLQRIRWQGHGTAHCIH